MPAAIIAKRTGLAGVFAAAALVCFSGCATSREKAPRAIAVDQDGPQNYYANPNAEAAPQGDATPGNSSNSDASTVAQDRNGVYHPQNYYPNPDTAQEQDSGDDGGSRDYILPFVYFTTDDYVGPGRLLHSLLGRGSSHHGGSKNSRGNSRSSGGSFFRSGPSFTLGGGRRH